MRTLALCAGYGGLEMGLAEVSPVDLVAYAEYDDAPARIMAHHHPGTPNLRDVTKIDWHALLALGIVVMTAGYPCQPFSHAGKREGENDPRHLWPHIARGIEGLRPALCVFENVRGHLSLGFDQVLLDLDALGYDVRYYLLRAADVGACHGRARLFIFATDRHQQGAVVPPTDAPVALVQDDEWVSPESHLFGREPFTGKLPPCGWLHDGALYAQPKWLSRNDARALLPTPRTNNTKSTRAMTSSRGNGRRSGGGQSSGPGLEEAAQLIAGHIPAHMPPIEDLPASTIALLPTPAVNDMGAAYTPETWDAWTDRMKAAHGNGNGHGKSLAIEAQRLLPTPVADNSRRLPSKGTDYASLANVAVSLLPTPSAADGMGGHLTRSGDRSNELLLPGAAKAMRETWGEYAPAIARWEVVLGRPAPAPTEEGPKGGHRLSPAFVEWMQGLPDGWVTDVPGLTRNQELKALGNGVVLQQCAAAYRAFLTDTRKAAAA